MGCVRVDDQGAVITYEPYSRSWSLVCAEDWTLDDAQYLCQELGFGHALSSDQHHVLFNGTWMAMKRDNLTATSLWTERVAYAESCNSNMAAVVECQAYDCGNYSGLLHRRRRRQAAELPATQWPFIAYVSTFQSTKGCLSEILTPVWMITSAECLLSIGKEPHNGSDWYVRTNVARGFDEELAQKHEVLKIIPHPHSSKFRSLILRDYDVALVRLRHALVFSDKIGAICLPEEQVPFGITCFSGVLGTEKPRAPPPLSPTISSLALMVLDREACNATSHYNKQISNTMLCTKSSDTTSVCDNDEGTPLMCLSGPNKWYLAGMLTYQRFCGVYNWHPAVFSNLFSMKGFIDQVIGHKQYRVHYDSSLYAITFPTTTEPTEVTTEFVSTTEANLETTVLDQYSSLNESSVVMENATEYANTTEEITSENATELWRIDSSTESIEKLLDIELRGNKTVSITTTIGNITLEESHTGMPELASVNETNESVAMKQPRISEALYGNETSGANQSEDTTLHPNQTATETAETLTAPTVTEDFAVDVIHSNSSEENSGYFNMNDVTTSVENYTAPTTTTTAESSTSSITVTSGSTSESTEPEKVILNGTASPSSNSTESNGNITDVTELAPDTSPISSLPFSTILDTSPTDTMAGENGETTTSLDDRVNDTTETSVTPTDVLVKEYVVRSRNIDVPLEMSVSNGTIMIFEGADKTETEKEETTATTTAITTEEYSTQFQESTVQDNTTITTSQDRTDIVSNVNSTTVEETTTGEYTTSNGAYSSASSSDIPETPTYSTEEVTSAQNLTSANPSSTDANE